MEEVFSLRYCPRSLCSYPRPWCSKAVFILGGFYSNHTISSESKPPIHLHILLLQGSSVCTHHHIVLVGGTSSWWKKFSRCVIILVPFLLLSPSFEVSHGLEVDQASGMGFSVVFQGRISWWVLLQSYDLL